MQRASGGRGRPVRADGGLPTRVRRVMLLHRRPISALLVALAAALTVAGIRPPEEERVAVLAATRRMEAGVAITASDVALVNLPKASLPPGWFADADQAVGRVTFGPVDPGEPLTANRVLGPNILDKSPGDGGPAPPLVAVTARLADAADTRMIRPGDWIDLLSARTASAADAGSGDAVAADAVATRVRVLGVPGGDAGEGQDFLGGAATDDGALIELAVTPDDARRIAAAAASSRLSAVLLPSQGT